MHAQKVINDNDIKIKVFQDKYNTTRKALIAVGANEVEMEWKEVRDVDLRCLEDEEVDAKHEEQQNKQAERRSLHSPTYSVPVRVDWRRLRTDSIWTLS